MKALCVCLMFAVSVWARAQSGDVRSAVMELEGRLAYEAATELSAAGDHAGAARRLRWVVSEAAGSEWATLAASKLVEVEALLDAPGRMSGATRAGLVTFGTVFTTWLGVGTLILTDSDSVELAGLALIGGPIVGMTYTLDITRTSAMSDGQASLVNLGGVWGVWQGAGAMIAADAPGKVGVAASMAGGLLGLGLTRSIVADRKVTSGDASLITASGVWGTWLTLCAVLAADVDDSDAVVTAALVGGDVALLAGAAAARSANMSRGRVRLITAGGMVGALYGWGATVLGDIESDRGGWGAIGTGTVVGLLAGTYLTRGMDASAPTDGFFSAGRTTMLRVTPRSVTYSVAF